MVKVYNISGEAVAETKLPKIFSTAYRPDVIKRAVLASQSRRRQRYGADTLAGKRTSAHYHGKRRYRWTMMNREMARIARIHGKVGFLAWTARFVPQARKGHRTHPPKAEKVWSEGINNKERKLAIRSALAASSDPKLVTARGHMPSVTEFPVVVISDFEIITKTQDIRQFMKKLAPKELKRCERKKIRAGKGKHRNRPYKKKKGPLVIASKECPLLKSAKNIPGFDVTTVNKLNTELLAPGAQAGRLVIITQPALKSLDRVV